MTLTALVRERPPALKQGGTALLVAHSGFAARYLLRTDIYRGLREAGMKVVILTPNPGEPYFTEEFADEQTVLAPLREKECKQAYLGARAWPLIETAHLYGSPLLT